MYLQRDYYYAILKVSNNKFVRADVKVRLERASHISLNLGTAPRYLFHLRLSGTPINIWNDTPVTILHQPFVRCTLLHDLRIRAGRMDVSRLVADLITRQARVTL